MVVSNAVQSTVFKRLMIDFHLYFILIFSNTQKH